MRKAIAVSNGWVKVSERTTKRRIRSSRGKVAMLIGGNSNKGRRLKIGGKKRVSG